MTGVILGLSILFGTGLAPFLLGTIADHYNFQVGILAVGIVTTLSSLLVGLLKEREEVQT